MAVDVYGAGVGISSPACWYGRWYSIGDAAVLAAERNVDELITAREVRACAER